MSLFVTAVVVSHDGEAYLPRTLSALRAQSRPIDAIVGVDTGSTDRSKQLLEGGAHPVLSAGRRAGFGQAVAAGLEAQAAGRATGGNPDPDQGPDDWIWLIHDDSAPDPEALEQLLHAVDISPSVAIVGCKQLDWDEPSLLHDVGLTASRWGRRITGLSPHEVDQGQYDDRTDTLAVNSAGLLIRRDVWQSLRGMDPNLKLFHDDIDLCRRAHLAGHRVVVAPQARMYHAEATTRGWRTADAIDGAVELTRRRNMIFARLVHAPWLAIPLHVIGTLLSGIARAIFRIAAKEPGSAGREIGASIEAVSHPVRLSGSRRRAARTRTLSRGSIRPLLAEPREVWRTIREEMAADPAGLEPRALKGADARPDAPADTESVVEDFSPLDTLGAPRRRIWSHPSVLSVAGLTVIALLALFRLLGPGHLQGGALLPSSARWGSLLSAATASWSATGLGHAVAADPLLAFLAPLSLVFAGSPNALIGFLIVGAVPLAGLGAWVAAGAATASRGVRSWAALVWAAMPSLTLAVDQGRLGAILAHVLLPWAILGIARATGSARARRFTGRPGTGTIPSWSAAAAGGLAIAGVAAGAPALLPALLLLLLAAVFVTPGGRRKTMTWLVLPTIAVYGPYILQIVKTPRLLVTDPGQLLVSAPAPAWQQLLLRPVAVDSWPWVDDLLKGSGHFLPLFAFAPVVVVAIAALFRTGGTGRVVRLGWGAVFLGLATAVLSGLIVVGATPTELVTGWTGAGVSLVGAGLLVAGVTGSVGLKARTAGAARRAGRVIVVVVTVLAVLGPVLSIGMWATQSLMKTSTTSLVARTTDLSVPAVAGDQGTGPDRTNTLVLTHGDGGLTGSLVRADGQTIASTSSAVAAARVDGWPPSPQRLTDADTADAQLSEAVAAVTAGSGGDPRSVLAGLGIGFVVLSDRMEAPAGANAPSRADDLSSEALLAGQRFDADQSAIAADISTCAGLSSVGNTSVGALWRVDAEDAASGADDTATRPARVRILDADGKQIGVVPSKRISVDTQVAAGPAGRTIVLAERKDRDWHATLNGQRLEAADAGWQQAFQLPAGSGELVIKHAPELHWLWPLGQGILLALAILLSIPLPGTRREAAPARRRPSRQPAAPSAGAPVTAAGAAPAATGAGGPDAGKQSTSGTGTVETASVEKLEKGDGQ